MTDSLMTLNGCNLLDLPEIFEAEAITDRAQIGQLFHGKLRPEQLPEKVIQFFDARSAKGSEHLTLAYIIVDCLDGQSTAIGGIRAVEDGTLYEVYQLASAMTKKNALSMLNVGGAKSIVLFNGEKVSRKHPEIMDEFFVKYATALSAFPEYTPGPDMGTNEHTMQTIENTICRLRGVEHAGAAAGRPSEHGGIPLDELGLTALGGIKALETFYAVFRDSPFAFPMESAVIQGFGNVGIPAATELSKKGVAIKAVTTQYGGFFRQQGLAIEDLAEYARQHSGDIMGWDGARDRTISPDELGQELEIECSILIPAARTDVITKLNAHRIKSRIILCLANAPVTPEALSILAGKGCIVTRDYGVNSGGVIGAAADRQVTVNPAYREQVFGAEGDSKKAADYVIDRMLKTVAANAETVGARYIEANSGGVIKKTMSEITDELAAERSKSEIQKERSSAPWI